MSETPALRLAEGVELGHALVEAAARKAGARVLFIKGPHQNSLGLRPERQSVDVDALTHPDDVERLRFALAEAGWHVRVPLTGPRVLPLHSATLACQGWPCELDLHHQFPGFFEDASGVFDLLWKRRRLATFADVPVSVPDLVSSVLIAALHLERDRQQRAVELEHLIRAVDQRLAPEELVELGELARATGSAGALTSFLNSVGAPLKLGGDDTASNMRAWAIRSATGDTHGVAWLYRLRHGTWREKFSLITHGLLSTEAELRATFPQARPGPAGLWQARWWRLRRAVSDLPRAIGLLHSADRESPRRSQ